MNFNPAVIFGPGDPAGMTGIVFDFLAGPICRNPSLLPVLRIVEVNDQPGISVPSVSASDVLITVNVEERCGSGGFEIMNPDQVVEFILIQPFFIVAVKKLWEGLRG